MNFFDSNISLVQAEQQLEDFILSQSSGEFYLKDIPLTEDDCRLVKKIVSEYSKNVYSFDDYEKILLLFIVDGYILSKTNDILSVVTTLFFNNASHIPQHHVRHLIYLVANTFMEFNIATFDIICTSFEDIMLVIKKHAEM